MDSEESKSKDISYYKTAIRKFYNKTNVKDIIVQKSDDGKKYRKIINGVYYIFTTGVEYEKMCEALENVKQERLEVANTEKERTEQLTKEEKNDSGSFSSMSKEEQEELLEHFATKDYPQKENTVTKPRKDLKTWKRNIKNLPRKFAEIKKRFIDNNKKTIAILVATGLAAGVGGAYLKNECDKYVATDYNLILDVGKKYLNADKIWDGSTMLSSTDGLTNYILTGNDGRYL